jgi:succinate dehydrogenase/fumarate reductase cytochrome b subunit
LIYSVKSAEKGVSGTLQWISNWISSYIDWFLFFVWTWAVILIMYNGIRLMFFSWIWQSEVDKVKSRMLNLAIGVIAITWVYLILRFAVWFINFIFR